MAEEENQTEETQSQESAESTASAKEESQQTEDWEAKYKSLQGEHQKAVEERDQYRDTLDTVHPYIDFERLQQGGQQAEEQQEEAVTKRELLGLERTIDNKLLTLDFRQQHPELREYEGTLVGPAIQRIRVSNPRMPLDKVLSRAAEETTKLLEAERAKGKAEAEQKKAEAAAASGLGSASKKSATKEEDQGESIEDIVARRTKQSLQRKGFEI